MCMHLCPHRHTDGEGWGVREVRQLPPLSLSVRERARARAKIGVRMGKDKGEDEVRVRATMRGRCATRRCEDGMVQGQGRK